MKYYTEIKSNSKNLDYYCKEIKKAAKAEFEEDLKIYSPLSEELSARLDMMGAISNAITNIELWLGVIATLTENAKEQDARIGIITEAEEE